MYQSCPNKSYKIFHSNDQIIINTTKRIQANALIKVSANHVFSISIAIITFFTTFHNQYKNQTNVIIKANEIFDFNSKK